MTGYVVHYIGGGSIGTETVSPSSTSTDIAGLTSGATYTISVEATSQHLPGESEEMTISLSELTYRSVLAELYTYMYISGYCSVHKIMKFITPNIITHYCYVHVQ